MIKPLTLVEQNYGLQDMKILKTKEVKMNWLFGKKDCTLDDIKKIEDTLSIKLPYDFIDIVLVHNGAYPEKNIYDMYDQKEKIIQCLVSCKNEPMGILDVVKNINIQYVVPFMRDPYGNYVCFQFENISDYKIVFWNHDTNSIQKITDTFSDFIEILYK